jgi:hypothetical protein
MPYGKLVTQNLTNMNLLTLSPTSLLMPLLAAKLGLEIMVPADPLEKATLDGERQSHGNFD